MDDIGELIAQLEQLRRSFDGQRQRFDAIARNISYTECALNKLLDDIQRLRSELAATARVLKQLEVRQRNMPYRHG